MTSLGLRLDGSLRGWQIHRRGRSIVAPPAHVWERQALILGETGSGKTVTALALASELLRVGWDVHWIDGTADPGTRLAFLAASSSVGVDARHGAAESIDGWRGGPEAVINRLLVTQNFTEPYYEGIARTALRAAVGNVPPRSFAELVDRIDKKLLTRALHDDRRAAELVHQLPDKRSPACGSATTASRGPSATPSTVPGPTRTLTPRMCLSVGRRIDTRPPRSARSSSRTCCTGRSRASRETGAPPSSLTSSQSSARVPARPSTSSNEHERAAVGIVLIGQTWASLGPDETIRSRLAGTVGTVILHQLKQPDESATLAATR